MLKKLRKVLLVFALAALSVALVTYAYEAYDKSIAVLYDRGLELRHYKPFDNEAKLARLCKPASLKINDELPKIDCATALYPIAAAFVEAVYPEGDYIQYSQQRPAQVASRRVFPDILTQTTTRNAFNRLAEGEVDIIFAAAPSQEQIEQAAEKGIVFQLTPIGKEAFVFFVNAQNPVENLTIEQLQAIYTGTLTNWQQVGGKNQEIKAFQREKNSGSQTALEKLMHDKQLMQAPIRETTGGMGGIIRRTADYKNYPNAIGFSFRYYVKEMVQNKQIKLLKINGIQADKSTIHSENYPLAANFYAITAGSKNPHLDEFINWILSEEGQQLIEASGYVGIK